MKCLTAKRLIGKNLGLAAAASLAVLSVSAPAPAEAQVRALLPTIEEVEPQGPLPIDGVWEIRELRERIVIVDGHAYAEDGWVHMLLFQIEPGQVVLKDIRELADGDFVAQDLPLMTSVTLEPVSPETLRARTEGLVPVTYHLDLVAGSGFEPPIDDYPPIDDEFPPIEEPPADDQEPIDPW